MLFKERRYCKAAYFFTSVNLKRNFYEVLATKCPICVDRIPDKTIWRTIQHMEEQHKLYYCFLCLIHGNKLFNEISYYTKKDLDKHKREGENTSHSGHPQCQICRQPCYDEDYLFKHMLKSHFVCHICDRGNDQKSVD